jgi:hypothetical protein
MPDLNSQQGLVYEGNIHARTYINNVLQKKAVGPFEITGFTAKASNEVKERKSNLVGQSGKVRGTFARITPTELKITANAANSDLYALFLLGSTAAYTVAGGSISAESVTFTELDKWYALDNKNVSAVVITGKVEGTDFEIDAQLGYIRALSTGSYTAGSTASVNYTAGAISGTTIQVGTQAKVDVMLDGRLTNAETGSQAILHVPKVTLSPTKELSLIGNDYQDFELTGKCILLNGEVADFYLRDPVTYS